MSEEEKKQLAVIAGVLLKLVNGQPISDEERLTLENITTDLGYWNLDPNDFTS